MARVNVYVTTPHARVEVSRSVSRVVAERSGRITAIGADLEASVAEGAVLVELDVALEQAELLHGQSEVDSLAARVTALDSQLEVERQRRRSRVRMDQLAVERADLGLEQARRALTQKAELAEISERLREARVSSRIDEVNALSELSRTEGEVGGAAIEIERLRAVQDYEDKSMLARIAEIERSRSELQAQRDVRLAELAMIRVHIERSKIRAPIAGKIGSIAALQVGDVVQAGDVVGSLIPEDDVRVVAEFEPGAAVGRIMPGQPAQLMLDGFSWTQFGALSASVAQVASEPRDGRIRVELELHAAQPSGVPVQHGLSGQVDVRVDVASPLDLCVRSLGASTPSPAPLEPVPGPAPRPRGSVARR